MDLRIREWGALEYFDPATVLQRLRSIERGRATEPHEWQDVPGRVRRLRVNDLKQAREARDAALFSHGLASLLGTKVYYAPIERSDYDFVCMFVVGDTQHFSAVQLKEVPPEDLAPQASLEAILSGLRKYPETDTVLAINYNRRERIDLSTLSLPDAPFREVWIFACTSPDQNRWILMGDFRGEAQQVAFEYPEAEEAAGPAL